MSSGLEEAGTVLAVEGDWAWVEVTRRGGCGGCASRATCAAGALASLFGRRPVRLRVRNWPNARVGERVLLTVDEGAVARGAASVYALPLVGLLAGAGLGQWIGARAGIPADAAALIAGLLGLLLGSTVVRRISLRGSAAAHYQPVLTRRVPDLRGRADCAAGAGEPDT